MSKITYQNIHARLVTAVPDFGPVVDEDLRDNGEVLQHVLFGDLTRFTIERWKRADTAVVQRILTLLDEAAQSGDEAVANLIAVSFVENVGPWNPWMADFIGRWPPSLRDIARDQGYKG